MISKFNIGDTKTFLRVVRPQDVAEFEAGQVHPFYATFALGRDAEWAGRLFVLEMLEEDEEGIGTSLTIDHRSPALEGQEVQITSTITALEGNQLDCSFEAKVGSRVIATGTTGQRILKKSVVQRIKEKAGSE